LPIWQVRENSVCDVHYALADGFHVDAPWAQLLQFDFSARMRQDRQPLYRSSPKPDFFTAAFFGI